MAEFQEVVKQAKRMCKSNGCTCNSCLLLDEKDECRHRDAIYNETPEDWKLDKLAEIERIVMDWAAEHPEEIYPTWKEWQDTNFPNNDSLILPCIFESEEYFGCKLEIECEKCINKPIPADIAEKLGIKPIGGQE